MFLSFLGHILCCFTTNVISFFSPHSCGCNAGTYVSNGAGLTELFHNYYASRTAPAIKISLLAHILRLFTTNFISFFSSHSRGCNSGTYVSNGAGLTELSYNYYASRTAPAIKISLFWKFGVNDFKKSIKARKNYFKIGKKF
jgi:hypothetical protein